MPSNSRSKFGQAIDKGFEVFSQIKMAYANLAQVIDFIGGP